MAGAQCWQVLFPLLLLNVGYKRSFDIRHVSNRQPLAGIKNNEEI
jgi:hypothetical protein